MKKYIIIGLFLGYLLLLIKVIVFKYPSSMLFDIADGNWVPFKTIVPYLRGQPTWIVAMYNIGGNVAHLGGALMGYFFIVEYKKGRDWTLWITGFLIG